MTHVQRVLVLGLVAIVLAATLAGYALTRPEPRAQSAPVVAASVAAPASPLAAWACWRIAVTEPAAYERRFGDATACVEAVAPYVEQATAPCASSFARATDSFNGCVLAYTRPAHAPGHPVG